MAWTSIPGSVYAVGKPITSVGYGYLKENIEVHDHVSGRGATIGTDGVNQNSITAASVGQGELKTATGSVSVAVGPLATGVTPALPGGGHGFTPRVKSSANAATSFDGLVELSLTTGYVAPGCAFTDLSGGGSTGFAEQTYIQSSPPYKIGNKKWGHFLFILRNIATSEIVGSYEAEDPPWAYNGPEYNPKDSIKRIQAVPHPFTQYYDKDPAIDGLEIILVDLREHDTKKWKSDNAKKGKGILEDLGHINKGGRIVTPQEVGIDDIQGFTDKVKIRKP